MNHDNSSQVLPPEIFELVIDSACDNEQLLATCALVNRNWLPASRRHLFASVDLHTGNVRGFLAIADSHCATFLHHIKRFKFRHGGDVELDDVQQIWNEAASRLALLPLSSVESLHLSQTRWESIYTQPASSTFSGIKELGLRETYFSPADAFFQFISQLHHLERLALHDVGYDSDDEVDLENCLPPQHIRSLSLQSLNDDIKTRIYRWFSSSPTIVELKIDEIEAEELGHLLPLFRSLSKSLETLDLSFLDNEDDLRSEAGTGMSTAPFQVRYSYKGQNSPNSLTYRSWLSCGFSELWWLMMSMRECQIGCMSAFQAFALPVCNALLSSLNNQMMNLTIFPIGAV